MAEADDASRVTAAQVAVGPLSPPSSAGAGSADGSAGAGAVDVSTEACEAFVLLTEAERRLLSVLPDAGQVLVDQVWCELEGGHDGPHWALGQLTGDDFWWLRWNGAQRRELVHHESCEQLAGPGEPGERDVPCALPAGHAGAHSYTRPS